MATALARPSLRKRSKSFDSSKKEILEEENQFPQASSTYVSTIPT